MDTYRSLICPPPPSPSSSLSSARVLQSWGRQEARGHSDFTGIIAGPPQLWMHPDYWHSRAPSPMWGVYMDYLGSLAEDSQFLDVDHLPNVTSSNSPSLGDTLCNLWLLATWLKPGPSSGIYLVHGRIINLYLLNCKSVTSQCLTLFPLLLLFPHLFSNRYMGRLINPLH